jgi:hypothetical protein
MNVDNLVEIANWLDQHAASNAAVDSKALSMAANAIDMAIQEVTASEDPFSDAIKCMIVYANILDADGHIKAASALDAVLQTINNKFAKTAATREELYDSKENNKATLFNSLLAEVENVEPIYDGLQGTATTLATRNSPDHPGVMMLRLSDGVYQDVMSKKVYDFNKGWIDEKGVKHPGGSVSNQTPIYNQYLYFPQIFESRHLTSRPK